MSGNFDALPFYDLDGMILEDAIRVSRGTLALGLVNPGGETPSSRGLYCARARHQSQILELLRPDLVPIQKHFISTVFLDYVPWIRCMVEIDDAFEKSGDWETKPITRTGRPSRTAGRSWTYVRQLTLSDNQRAIVAATGFNLGLH